MVGGRLRHLRERVGYPLRHVGRRLRNTGHSGAEPPADLPTGPATHTSHTRERPRHPGCRVRRRGRHPINRHAEPARSLRTGPGHVPRQTVERPRGLRRLLIRRVRHTGEVLREPLRPLLASLRQGPIDLPSRVLNLAREVPHSVHSALNPATGALLQSVTSRVPGLAEKVFQVRLEVAEIGLDLNLRCSNSHTGGHLTLSTDGYDQPPIPQPPGGPKPHVQVISTDYPVIADRARACASSSSRLNPLWLVPPAAPRFALGLYSSRVNRCDSFSSL